jgi:hypothetical protein
MTFSCVEITCDAVFDKTNDSQKEQVDLIDDEEAPCDTLQRMSISGIRHQDPSDQPQGQSPNDTTPPEQGLDQDKNEDEMSTMIKSKRRAMIKGEMRMMEIMEHHHIQEPQRSKRSPRKQHNW